MRVICWLRIVINEYVIYSKSSGSNSEDHRSKLSSIDLKTQLVSCTVKLQRKPRSIICRCSVFWIRYF